MVIASRIAAEAIAPRRVAGERSFAIRSAMVRPPVPVLALVLLLVVRGLPLVLLLLRLRDVVAGAEASAACDFRGGKRRAALAVALVGGFARGRLLCEFEAST